MNEKKKASLRMGRSNQDFLSRAANGRSNQDLLSRAANGLSNQDLLSRAVDDGSESGPCNDVVECDDEQYEFRPVDDSQWWFRCDVIRLSDEITVGEVRYSGPREPREELVGHRLDSGLSREAFFLIVDTWRKHVLG
jgi:hypothetical protein